jgi:hypothetical protein
VRRTVQRQRTRPIRSAVGGGPERAR